MHLLLEVQSFVEVRYYSYKVITSNWVEVDISRDLTFAFIITNHIVIIRVVQVEVAVGIVIVISTNSFLFNYIDKYFSVINFFL